MARRFAGPKLVVATHNRGKAGEIRAMLSPLGVEIVSAGELEPESIHTPHLYVDRLVLSR